jgi:uncharacterized protein YcgL (UPF0745 family)
MTVAYPGAGLHRSIRIYFVNAWKSATSQSPEKDMTACKVFRSDNKSETYLYLARNCEFTDLPEELQQHFGEPAFVMNLELSADRKLARVDVEKVLLGLQESGYYLQLPPKLPVEEELTEWLN